MTELSGLEARERIRERALGRQHDAQERAVIGDGEALIGRRRIHWTATRLCTPTGFALYEPSMGGKWLELLKQIAPGVTRVALLFNPATTVPVKFYMSSIEAAASSFAIQASTAPV